MDCQVNTGDLQFRYRAGAIIIEEGCVLLARRDAHHAHSAFCFPKRKKELFR